MLGISSKFLNTVISMYSQAKACVRIGNTVSGTFQCSKGVKQGCPLSPILFCLFISDIFQKIGTGLPGIEIGKQLIHGLLYADDAVLMSKNEKDMASLLRQLEVYCSKWNLKVNTSKTKMMRIGDPSKKTTFKYIGVELDEVTEFNYLGFHINNAGDLSRGMGYRADAARKAYYSLTQILRKLTGLTIPDCCYIFTACIEPVMLYACELWGVLKDKNMEALLLRFCKTILKVPPSCTICSGVWRARQSSNFHNLPNKIS